MDDLRLIRVLVDANEDRWAQAAQVVTSTTSQEELRRIALFEPGIPGLTALGHAALGNTSQDQAHLLFSILVQRDPGLFRVRTSQGNLLLHLLLLNSRTSQLDTLQEVLRAMLRFGLETENGPNVTKLAVQRPVVHREERRASNPLIELCFAAKGLLTYTHEFFVNRNFLPGIAVEVFSKIPFKFEEKLTLLLKAFYHGSIEDPLPDGKHFRMLHACCGIQHCPPYVLRLIVDVIHPRQMMELDENGNMPIHVAAMASFERDPREAPADSEEIVQRCGVMKTTIQTLLEANPHAATCFNREGKLPLQLAIDSGREWDEGVETLFNAFPGANCVQHRETGLIPFMQAAADNTSPLTVVYELLRANPVLDNYVTPTTPMGWMPPARAQRYPQQKAVAKVPHRAARKPLAYKRYAYGYQMTNLEN